MTYKDAVELAGKKAGARYFADGSDDVSTPTVLLAAKFNIAADIVENDLLWCMHVESEQLERETYEVSHAY